MDRHPRHLGDARGIRLSLTPLGRRLWKRSPPPFQVGLTRALQDLPAAQLRELRRDHAQLLSGLDQNHAALAAEVASIAARTGAPITLEGHPRLYSMLAFTAPPGALTGNPARDYYQALRPHLVRWARLLTLYLRLQGVYMETLPTTDLSTAHAPEDIRQIADALGRALAQMREHGVFT